MKKKKKTENRIAKQPSKAQLRGHSVEILPMSSRQRFYCRHPDSVFPGRILCFSSAFQEPCRTIGHLQNYQGVQVLHGAVTMATLGKLRWPRLGTGWGINKPILCSCAQVSPPSFLLLLSAPHIITAWWLQAPNVLPFHSFCLGNQFYCWIERCSE